ncbi:MAG: LPD38 domain-containing protein, partial [Xanthomonadales bacterium]|nr:LPD38 domain-containing protein [Xanthomonadales bacterium]
TVGAKGMMIAMASLALLLRNKDDERYEDLEDWDKDTYWHVFLPEPIEIGGSNVSHVRIPKPFEVGVIFGTMPERIALNLLGKDDNDKTFERFLWSLRETLAFDPIPHAVAPAQEVFANWDRFRESPIESFSDQQVSNEDRYNAYTSPTAIQIGKLTGRIGISPKEVEHLWRGYSGTLGMYVLSVSDYAMRSATDAPPQPTLRIDQYPVIGSFLRSEPARSTKWLTELYNMRQALNEINGSLNKFEREGNIGRWIEIAETESEFGVPKEMALSVRPEIESAATFNSQLRRETDAIINDRNMTPAEKRELIDELISRRNVNAKETLKMVREFLSENQPE